MNNDKKSFTWSTIWKVVLGILVIILSIFFIFGLIGRAIKVMIQNQEKQVDKDMSKLIVTKVVCKEDDFTRIAKYKSKVHFFKRSILPLSMLFVVFIMYLITMSINNWSQSMFQLFGQMIYPWTGLPTYIPPLGFDFSSVGANYVNMNNWFSIMTLITIILFFIGILWYSYQISGYMARSYRIRKLKQKMFSKNLDTVDLSSFITPTATGLMPNNQEKEETKTNLNSPIS